MCLVYEDAVKNGQKQPRRFKIQKQQTTNRLGLSGCKLPGEQQMRQQQQQQQLK